MKKVRLSVAGLCLGVLALAAAPASSQHENCNCWDGNYICVYHDDNHEIMGYRIKLNADFC